MKSATQWKEEAMLLGLGSKSPWSQALRSLRNGLSYWVSFQTLHVLPQLDISFVSPLPRMGFNLASGRSSLRLLGHVNYIAVLTTHISQSHENIIIQTFLKWEKPRKWKGRRVRDEKVLSPNIKPFLQLKLRITSHFNLKFSSRELSKA